MTNTLNTSVTWGPIAVVDPTNPDGTPWFNVNSSGTFVNGNPVNSDNVVTSITAHSGGGQSSATALTGNYNNVTTVAANFDSVKLLLAASNVAQTVKNNGASIVSVFPNTGDTLNGLAANLSIDIPIGGQVLFTPVSATNWQTNTTVTLPSPSTQKGDLVIKAADNAGNTQTIITNASQAAARTYTIPDSGNATDTFVLQGSIGGMQCSRTSTTTTVTSSTVLVAVTGLTQNVVAAGTYDFDIHLAITSGASGGSQAAMGGTSTWTSINTTVYNYTASAVAVTTGTTATPATAIAGSTASNIAVMLKGTVVVNAAGTFFPMIAQNASNGTSTVVLANSYMNLTRIA